MKGPGRSLTSCAMDKRTAPRLLAKHVGLSARATLTRLKAMTSGGLLLKLAWDPTIRSACTPWRDKGDLCLGFAYFKFVLESPNSGEITSTHRSV